jgi:hypothetical protein
VLNGFACSTIEQQRESAASDVLRRFAHVPIGEDGWPVRSDKLLKKDEFKVDEIQSRHARGVVIALCLVLARKPLHGHAHRSLCTRSLFMWSDFVSSGMFGETWTADMSMVWRKVDAL